MKHVIAKLICTIAILGIFSTAQAEKLFSMKIGMLWPQALLNTSIPSGDAELEYGVIVDKKVGFGLSGNFLWNVQSTESKDPSGHTKVISEEQTFMFPIMGFFLVDPVPEMIVHPVLRFQIGYNSMIYNVRTDSTQITPSSKPETLSPYFYGLIIKASADALYNMGERSAIFLGLEYQWAGTKTADTKNGLFDKRDMSGIGLRAGFRVIL